MYTKSTFLRFNQSIKGSGQYCKSFPWSLDFSGLCIHYKVISNLSFAQLSVTRTLRYLPYIGLWEPKVFSLLVPHSKRQLFPHALLFIKAQNFLLPPVQVFPHNVYFLSAKLAPFQEGIEPVTLADRYLNGDIGAPLSSP